MCGDDLMQVHTTYNQYVPFVKELQNKNEVRRQQQTLEMVDFLLSVIDKED